MNRDQLQEVIAEPLAELCARMNDKEGREVYDHFIDVVMAVVEAAQESSTHHPVERYWACVCGETHK